MAVVCMFSCSSQLLATTRALLNSHTAFQADVCWLLRHCPFTLSSLSPTRCLACVCFVPLPTPPTTPQPPSHTTSQPSPHNRLCVP